MLSFGDASPFVGPVRQAGARLILQVQSLAAARAAVALGPDAIVAQGTEAGGHGAARALFPLLPAVVDVAGDIPVLAAGGIGDGRGLAGALALGAAGALLGTRFHAAQESLGHPEAKNRLVTASGDDTVRTTVFDQVRGLEWPPPYTGRALQNTFTRAWHGREAELTRHPDAKASYQRAAATNDFDTALIWAGEGVGAVRAIEPAAAIVDRIMAEALAATERLRALTRPGARVPRPSPAATPRAAASAGEVALADLRIGNVYLAARHPSSARIVPCRRSTDPWTDIHGEVRYSAHFARQSMEVLMTKMLTKATGMLVLGGTLLAGCGGQEGESTVVEQAPVAELLASVQLSPTHEVTFWDHGGDLGRVQELFDGDLDRDMPLSLENVGLETHTLAQIYERFAGQRAEPSAVNRLHMLDLRVAETKQRAALEPQEPVLPEATATFDTDTARPPATLSSPGGDIEVKQGAAACSEGPSFSALADAAAFAVFGCGNGVAATCLSNRTSASWGFDEYLSFFRSDVWNQSSCTTALWTITVRKWAGFPSFGITDQALVNMRLPFRVSGRQAFTASGHIAFKATMTSDTGQNPISFAVHRTHQ